MSRIIYFTIYIAIWITVANVILSALEYSIEQMGGSPVAARESQSRVAEVRDHALYPVVVESDDTGQ